MAILSKGYSFGATEQVTSVKLGNLVDAATFASGAVDGISTDLSSGSIIVKNGGITPTKLSTGAPTWDGSGNVTLTGSLTGTSATLSGAASVGGNLTVTGTGTIGSSLTLTGSLIRSGTSSGRTVTLTTGSASPNAISFGWDQGDLLVTVDGAEFKVTLTPV